MCPHLSDSSTTWPTSWRLFHHLDFLRRAWTFCAALLFTDRAILRTYTKSSFPSVYIDTNFSSQWLSWAKKSLFKGTKNNSRVSASFWRREAPANRFQDFERWLLTRGWLTELNLVSIELPCYEDYEYSMCSKYLHDVCEQNGNTKYLATPFFA